MANDPSDIWAIGVITYFLLCGYTPFDRDSNLEEMQAILVADYSFTPLEYWRGVSQVARDFIKRCLTVDDAARMTAHAALQHPWVAVRPSADLSMEGVQDGVNVVEEPARDLLPVIKKNFNARKTLHTAIDTIRAINKLREGGAAGMMNGALSRDPARRGPPEANHGSELLKKPVEDDEGEQKMTNEEKGTSEGGDCMEIDGRGHGKGQTDQMIQAQEKKVQDTSKGLWSKGSG